MPPLGLNLSKKFHGRMGTKLTEKSSVSQNSLITAARYLWANQWARTDQIPPDTNWATWLILSGRGWGKTRTGAEWLAWNAVSAPNTRWAVIAATFADARDTCLEGESGLLTVLRRYRAFDERRWNRSLGELVLRNGSRIKLFSAEEPERLRGPQHHGAWCDELAAWKYEETFDQLQFGLRLGQAPKTVVTTTPKPVKLVRDLLKRNDTFVTRGATFDNKDNLAAPALAQLMAKYEGTRMGRQELYGELLEDVDGALWTLGILDGNRVKETTTDVVRRVVAVDPAITNTADSDETGIIVASRDSEGHGFVEADYSFKGSPDAWARKVVSVYDSHDCDAIVVEINQGGDMVINTLKSVRPNINVRAVRASKGKRLRAEPISAMYEQGRIHHVGSFPELEDQMTTWQPDTPKSPDRLDALVWALTELMDSGYSEAFLRSLARMCSCGFPNVKNALQCSKCGEMLREGEHGA